MMASQGTAELARALPARAGLMARASRLVESGLWSRTRSSLLAEQLGVMPAAPALSLADIAAVPDWLPAGAGAVARLGRRAAFAYAAPFLRQSIDGALLRAAGDVVGPEALDWALESDDQQITPDPRVAAEALADMTSLDRLGLALLRSALPGALRPLVVSATESPEVPACVALAAIERAAAGNIPL